MGLPEILIKINLEKALKLNSTQSKKNSFKEFHELHHDLKIAT